MAGGSAPHRRLHHLIERHVRASPDRVAVVTETAELRYGELDTRANQLAHHLRAAGLSPGRTVAIRMERHPDLLVAVLATLKAGGACALIDQRRGARETGRLLKSTKAVAVVTRGGLRPDFDAGRRPVVDLDADAAAIGAHATEPPEPGTGPADATELAAVLLTAGITGSRRAVPAGHRRLLAAYDAWAEVFALGPEDRHLVTAPADSVSFTAGWIRALCSGATLALPTGPLNSRLLKGAWGRAVTVLDTDPGTAASVLDRTPRPERLRLVAVGGERLPLAEQSRLHALLAPGVRLLNVYGPAEVAGCGTWFETDQLTAPVAEPERVVLLGRPLPGCHAEIRKGQIWLGAPDGGDLVNTRDRGAQRPDGLLEFLGRTTDSVTARGRTVHPYRAEAALAGHPGVREVAIAAGTGPDGTRLIAYVVPEKGAGPDVATLRAHLTGTVPDAEIPTTVVRLGSLPRDDAGKIDRNALPLPPQSRSRPAGGKGADLSPEDVASLARWCGLPLLALAFAVFLTDTFWPGSTDLTGVPNPWAWCFRGLYAAEWLAFAGGVTFLFNGWRALRRLGRPLPLTVAAHLSLVWLLASWWPQDNFYRLAAKDDWPQQAALVYSFNVPLMIAAGIVVAFAVWDSDPPARR
ncbi:AMP-binding protein [Streptomyces litchfieldiae]|uniref:AMP-binding protein n=1 Tax=Streptomyces litchfieldiae TaxID=3075543 RepID=A0ABU2MPG4_9ACTN|nr:AMP-binding protein [Streptomyces sp. DSM 44938]MDT0343522.1 AMP-binding protein [Streptomyces sp. DSM 44938]